MRTYFLNGDYRKVCLLLTKRQFVYKNENIYCQPLATGNTTVYRPLIDQCNLFTDFWPSYPGVNKE